MSHALPLFQPETLKSGEGVERIRASLPDALVVAAYGLILPTAVLDIAKHGAINIHASLLPRWRGAAPIQRAILAGDRDTGISIMQMDAGLDTGPVLARESIPIEADDDAGTLHDRLAVLGARMIVTTLRSLGEGRAQAIPQPDAGASYARKVRKEEAMLDWGRPAVELERAVRAFRPAPGATTRLQGEILKIWRVSVIEARGAPGHVLSADGEGIVVGCGDGALLLRELQRQGGRRLPVAEFLRGWPVGPGQRFG
jgi:methionyl-tRNA formyltransferase